MLPVHCRIISEARSYGETTVHPPTKPAHTNNSIYDKPLSTILMDEANTMTERDMGSTFLLPHTHLYKIDRVSIGNHHYILMRVQCVCAINRIRNH